MSARDLPVVATRTGENGTTAMWHCTWFQEVKGSFPFSMPSHLVLATHLPGSVIELPRLGQGGKLVLPLLLQELFLQTPLLPLQGNFGPSTEPSAWARPSCSTTEPLSTGLAVFLGAGDWCSLVQKDLHCCLWHPLPQTCQGHPGKVLTPEGTALPRVGIPGLCIPSTPSQARSRP